MQKIGGKIMKKHVLLALLLCVSLLLTSCTANDTAEQAAGMFETIESYGSYGSVVVDTHTGVMYYRSNAPDARGMLTLLVNADGTPRVWTQP